jgi:meso-butanediol dehydrogenase/(S,S)-butanediol dehydrogenase/diacetyl reductase
MIVKSVIVTGGASGIGKEIVRALPEEMTVLVVDKAAYIPERRNVHAIKADVSNESDVHDIFSYAAQRLGRIDALVNNAGISSRSPFVETTLQSWNAVVETNLSGPFLMARGFAALKANGNEPRRIINIASVSGIVGLPNYAAYNVSKAGLIALTKTLAVELAPSIHTCAVCPGYILTPMQAAEYSAAELEACANANPSKRLGQPTEIAELVAFLLSGKCNYFNGSIIVVDGGETAGGLASK